MNEQNTPATAQASPQAADASAFQASFEEAAAQTEQPTKAMASGPASSPEKPGTAKAPEATASSNKTEKDLKALLAEERAKREQLEAQLRKEKQADPHTDPATDERLIQRFLDSKPEMEAPLCALIRREALKAIRPMAEAIMGEQHIQRIARAHPDWDTLAKSSELTRWIDEQPPYIAKSLRQVVARGHADDVIDLLSRFKEQIKAQKPFNDPATDCALAVPAHSSGLPKATPDKEDFKNAWREAVAGNDH